MATMAPQWTCNGLTPQAWRLQTLSNGYSEHRASARSDELLDHGRQRGRRVHLAQQCLSAMADNTHHRWLLPAHQSQQRQRSSRSDIAPVVGKGVRRGICKSPADGPRESILLD